MNIKILKTCLNRPLYIQLLFSFFAFLIMGVLSCIFTSRIVRANLVRNSDSMLDYMESKIIAELLESRTILDEFAEAL